MLITDVGLSAFFLPSKVDFRFFGILACFDGICDEKIPLELGGHKGHHQPARYMGTNL